MTGLLPLEEALARMLATPAASPGIEEIPLLDALGRTLAQEIVSGVAVPPTDNSAMDGYALRASDAGLGQLRVSQRIPAGSVPQPLEPQTAARIFTGASHYAVAQR